MNIKEIIKSIEKRVWILSESEKNEVAEIVEKYEDGEFPDIEKMAYEIADMLRTNEAVIYDILQTVKK